GRGRARPVGSRPPGGAARAAARPAGGAAPHAPSRSGAPPAARERSVMTGVGGRASALTQPHPYPGRLITVEGIDGSGKSTQLMLLDRWLSARGYRVKFTEWNSSPLVRRAMKRGKKKDLLTPTTFSLLHAVDFADRLKYHEAGMDVGLSPSPVESFRLFQSRVLDLYDRLTEEYALRVIDATGSIPGQQKLVRRLVQGVLREYQSDGGR